MIRPASLLLALLILGFTSCEFHHDEVYEEPITSLTYIFTPDNGTTVVLQYLDRDGEGGQPAVINSGSLAPSTTYQGQLQLNSLGKHIPDTTSIARNPENYQVFFLPQNGLELQAGYNDLDANGSPVGLKTTIHTGPSSEGRLMVIIKRNPDKSAAGVVDGNITNAGGKTSFEVSFDVRIEANS